LSTYFVLYKQNNETVAKEVTIIP